MRSDPQQGKDAQDKGAFDPYHKLIAAKVVVHDSIAGVSMLGAAVVASGVSMISTSRQNRLLGLIYDAAFDPELWVPVMEELVDELSADTACMVSLDIVTGVGDGCTARAPGNTMSAYAAHWAQDNPLHEVGDALTYALNWQPAILRYEDWVDRRLLHRSAYFNEFLRPLGAENGIMVRLALTGTTTTTMNIARSLQRDVFNDEEVAQAAWWQTHIVRAERMGRQVAIAQTSIDAIDHLVATTRHRLLFLDRRGRVQRASAAVEPMLRAGTPLRTANTLLSAVLPNDDLILQRLIAQAGCSDGAARRAGSMQMQGPGGAPLEVTVAPLGERASAWSIEPMVLVTVADRTLAQLPAEWVIRRRFGLTPAEGRLAVALAAGGTLRDAAERAEVSINTVRTQLAAIFAKTGCRRQSDLVRMLLSLDRGDS